MTDLVDEVGLCLERRREVVLGVVHGYGDVDHERLYRESKAGVAALERFLAVAAEAAGI